MDSITQRHIRTRLAVLALAAAGVVPSVTHAQEGGWPAKPVRVVVPYAAGGGVDRSARIVAQRLGASLNQAFVVENRPGGATVIAADAVAKAEADGYTLLTAAPAVLTVNPGLYSSLPYKPEDLAPVAMIGRIPLFLIVAPDSAARNANELFERARRQSLTYASAGNGSMTHLGAELIKMQQGFALTHVPYKGTAALLPDVASGRVDFALADLGPIRGLLDGGRLRVLATTSAARSTLMPTAPSMNDVGVRGVDVATWVAFVAPGATPEAIQRRIHSEVNKALADAGVQRELTQAGIEPTPMDQSAFVRLVSEERARWRSVIQASNIKPD